MRFFVKHNSLGLFFGLIFVITLALQSFAGWHQFNVQQVAGHLDTLAWGSYVTSSNFAVDVAENWQSEFLQMASYIALTIFLVQKGSAESNKPEDERDEDEKEDDPEAHRDDPNAPWPVRRGGIWLSLYKNSLFLAFLILFLASMLGHALGGAAEYNAEQAEHGNPSQVSVVRFVETSEFWYQSFQNWQSEFLAVGSIVVLSIFLRQQGSPESKLVYASNRATGSD
jgi:hypothetical protein